MFIDALKILILCQGICMKKNDCVYNLIIKSHSSRVGSEEERAIAKLTPKSMLGTITCTIQFHIFKVHTHEGKKMVAE